MERHEVEFKWVLPDGSARTAILADLGVPEVPRRVLQVNHFLDAEDRRLRAAGFAVRVREEACAFRLTLKGEGRRAFDGVLSVRPEEEAALDVPRARAALAAPCDARELLASLASTPLGERVLAALGDRPLVRLGAFENERVRVGPLTLDAQSAPLWFEFDRTTFPDGRVDHELEVEVAARDAARVERRLRELAATLSIPWRSGPSKAARFFATLSEPHP